MVRALPVGYVFNPDDPRAPTLEQWAKMSLRERARVVEMLPARLPMHLSPPKGDLHRKAKLQALDVLDIFFRHAGCASSSATPLEDTEEIIARLGGMLDRAIAREESALRLAEDLAARLREERLKNKAERRKRKDDRKRLKEEQTKRKELERLLAEARAEIERSKC